ncbi:MAG: DUF881 domain-containing protein [Chloroflexi bacterium]|nr:DUF881 domain-containing protein [Chloroflexota bacterium]
MPLGLALGLLLAAQLQSPPAQVSQTDESSRQVATATIQRLEAEQADLKKAIAQLRTETTARQQQTTTDKSALSDLRRELEQMQIAAGVKAMKGPGVRVILDDSMAKTVPADDDPAFYLVHEYHLRDVINLLWRSGAEAIAVNGERLVGTSSVYCVGSTIMVNDTRMSPPFEILAIGNPNSMEDALNNPSNLRSLKTRVKAYGVQFKESKQKEITVPAYNGSMEIKYSSSDSVD